MKIDTNSAISTIGDFFLNKLYVNLYNIRISVRFMNKRVAILIIFLSFFISNLNSQISVSVEDERIYRRFSKEQLEQWKSEDPIQILYLNYLYKDSYILKNEVFGVSQNIDPARTDIMNFEHRRKENERITYVISPWGTI